MLLGELLPTMAVVLTVVAGFGAYRKATDYTAVRDVETEEARQRLRFTLDGALGVVSLGYLVGSPLLTFAPIGVIAYVVGRRMMNRKKATGNYI